MYKKHFKKVHWGSEEQFAQPKLNGNRCHAWREGKKITLLTRSGITVVGTPHLHNQLLDLMKVGETWDGELYIHAMTVTSLNSLLKKHQPGSENVCFNIYDKVSPAPFADRLSGIRKSLKGVSGSIEMVETIKIKTEQEFKQLYHGWLEDDFEGDMLRHGYAGYESGARSYSLLKDKPRADTEFLITGVEEGSGTYAGMAKFVCVTAAGHEFRVTAPGKHPVKKKFWEHRADQIGRMATVEFECMTETEKPVPFQPVRVGVDVTRISNLQPWENPK